jgi:Flp pilus assembly protein TadG
MSLINDALKRAKQSIQRKPPGLVSSEETGGMPPLQPVYGAATDSGGFDWTFVKLGLLALLVVGGIAFKVWPYIHKKTQVKAAAIVPARTITSQGDPATNNNPIARAKRTFDKVHDLHAEGEANYSMIDAKPAPSAVPVASPTVTTVAPEVKTDPSTSSGPRSTVAKVADNADSAGTPRLQAVFFRESNPTALINGKSVGLGEEIDGAKVKSILPQSVVLDYPGGPKELSLR